MTVDALALLVQDHRAVRKLFAAYARLGDRAMTRKADLVAQMSRELAVHAAVEEHVFYPQARSLGRQVKEVVLEAIEEHRLIKSAIAQLATMRPGDERYDARVRVLMKLVDLHFGEEEAEMFPRVREQMDHRALQDLGVELAAATVRQQTVRHPGAAGSSSAGAGRPARLAIDDQDDFDPDGSSDDEPWPVLTLVPPRSR